MEKYFNKKLYTDVQSWKVIELDEVKGEATVIAVEKNLKIWNLLKVDLLLIV